MREINSLRKRQVEIELHKQILSEYYRTREVPRGYRIRNQPTIDQHKREFCEKWCEVSTQISLNYMLLVIKEVKVQLSQVNSELSALKLSVQDKNKQIEY